jgi:hypothetical protein
MSFRAVAWTLLAAMAFAAVLLFNHWAAYQPLSTLTYTGIVLGLCGLANVVLPFRFLGIRKRILGALILAGGVALSLTALFWPASTIRVSQPGTRLDQILQEYQFSERHSTRIHAKPEQVMQAVRESTFADMKSLVTLLKIRGAVLRTPVHDSGGFADTRVLDGFSKSGYFFDESEREIAMFGVWNARANRRPDLYSLREFAAYREQGAVKMGFDFIVEGAGEGWCTLTTETRVVALDVTRGMASYWRLIVPGSGLLRLQWLEGIKRRAESVPGPKSAPAS